MKGLFFRGPWVTCFCSCNCRNPNKKKKAKPVVPTNDERRDSTNQKASLTSRQGRPSSSRPTSPQVTFDVDRRPEDDSYPSSNSIDSHNDKEHPPKDGLPHPQEAAKDTHDGKADTKREDVADDHYVTKKNGVELDSEEAKPATSALDRHKKMPSSTDDIDNPHKNIESKDHLAQ
ncbi:hypothetical protein KP509_13G096700 [Ceratopteris richardii]|uniref:Uncharacterized protein n=1 Tax=Ceratopteris richardii TaxID=49495 RepID=A0A8T2TKE0_CERRI|nr:hypothetical protein KP509_13G096700 [Ceratopteris richardii]